MVWIHDARRQARPRDVANGMLAGLVAITAPCAFVDPWEAAVIGLIAGVIVIESIFLVERRFEIDGPVGAISVHGVNGLFGVLAVGIFANGEYGTGWNLTAGVDGGVTGILYGGTGGEQFVAQAIGVITIIIVGGLLSFGLFTPAG